VHVTASPVDWYAVRASGIAAYILLTLVVLVGVGLAGRFRFPGWPRFGIEDIHRFGALLAALLLWTHIVTTAIDAYMPFSLVDLLVPFAGPYRPAWMGLGILAAELLAVLAIANRARRRLSHRTWRRLHYLNFLAWAGATAHGIGAGTDRHEPWVVAIYVAGAGCVSAAVAMRLTRVVGARVRPTLAGMAGAAVALALAALPAGASSGAPSSRRPTGHFPRQLSASLEAEVRAQSGGWRELLSVVGEGRGDERVFLRIDLLVEGRWIERTSLQIADPRSGSVCSGEIDDIGGAGFQGTCRLSEGEERTVQGRWTIGDDESVRGRLTIVPRRGG